MSGTATALLSTVEWFHGAEPAKGIAFRERYRFHTREGGKFPAVGWLDARKHLIREELGSIFRFQREGFTLNRNAHAVLAVTHAKLSAESDFVFQVIVVYEVLKLFNDFTRTLKVAGAADANYYFHIITIPFP